MVLHIEQAAVISCLSYMYMYVHVLNIYVFAIAPEMQIVNGIQVCTCTAREKMNRKFRTIDLKNHHLPLL